MSAHRGTWHARAIRGVVLTFLFGAAGCATGGARRAHAERERLRAQLDTVGAEQQRLIQRLDAVVAAQALLRQSVDSVAMESMRLRAALDTVTWQRDSLRVELRRLKEIDLRPRPRDQDGR